MSIAVFGGNRDISVLQPTSYLGEAESRQGKAYDDGAYLIDCDDACRIAGANDIAGIEQPHSRAPIDRRSDLAVVELKLREIDLGLIGLHARRKLRDQCPVGVVLLGRGDPFADQFIAAREIEARIVELGLILQLCGICLRQSRRERARIDFGQDIAGMDLLALDKIDLEYLTVDTALHEYAVGRLDGTESGEIYRRIGDASHVCKDRSTLGRRSRIGGSRMIAL